MRRVRRRWERLRYSGWGEWIVGVVWASEELCEGVVIGRAKARLWLGMDSQKAGADRLSPGRDGAKRRTAEPLTVVERKLPLRGSSQPVRAGHHNCLVSFVPKVL